MRLSEINTRQVKRLLENPENLDRESPKFPPQYG